MRGSAQRGFTLLEVLLAVAITALIGVTSAQLLRSVIDTKQGTDIRSEKLASLQRFNMVISRDIEQLINRTIRDEYGDTQESLRIDDGDYAVEFTRSGWRNSPVASDPRSELQRVAYRTEEIDSEVCEPAYLRLQSWGVIEPEGECLVRYFWPVLDRSTDSEPLAQVVLEQIDDLRVEVLVEERTADRDETSVADSDWYDSWPPVTSGSGSSMTPVAMRWQITLPDLGEIERQWIIPWGDF